MSMIVRILPGLIVSKTVSTTGEGTVVDILPGIVGAVAAGWLFGVFGGTTVTGFDAASLYSTAVAAIGAIILPALYRVFLRRHML
jgi:uncharacterized membrane protein YeaQ/YmgE (transglycosylase-associated protein family)